MSVHTCTCIYIHVCVCIITSIYMYMYVCACMHLAIAYMYYTYSTIIQAVQRKSPRKFPGKCGILHIANIHITCIIHVHVHVHVHVYAILSHVHMHVYTHIYTSPCRCTVTTLYGHTVTYSSEKRSLERGWEAWENRGSGSGLLSWLYM